MCTLEIERSVGEFENMLNRVKEHKSSLVKCAGEYKDLVQKILSYFESDRNLSLLRNTLATGNVVLINNSPSDINLLGKRPLDKPNLDVWAESLLFAEKFSKNSITFSFPSSFPLLGLSVLSKLSLSNDINDFHELEKVLYWLGLLEYFMKLGYKSSEIPNAVLTFSTGNGFMVLNQDNTFQY